MRKFIIIVFIILFAIALVIIIKSTKTEDSKVLDSGTTPTDSVASSAVNASVEPSVAAPQVVSVTVNGGNFSFTPSIIKAKEGDTVNVTFVNDEGFHDFKIDEFNVATKILKTGEQETVSFVVNKKGSFEYYCSVGTHRQMGMKGSLIVE